jgi:sentrin-specific protease 1
MLNARNTARNGRDYFFTSWLLYRLLGSENNVYDHANVQRWTGAARMKIDLSKMRYIFFPQNIQNIHWNLLVADISKKEVRLYDSFGRVPEPGASEKRMARAKNDEKSRLRMMEVVSRYITDEFRVRKTGSSDRSQWRHVDMSQTCPQQTNGVDCGVFMLMHADFISNNCAPTFSQGNMSFFRTKIATDFLRGNLIV